VYCFDGDNAGRKAAWRALEVSLPLTTENKPMKFLFLPHEDDPDTFVRKHGKEAFEKRVREAQTLSEFLLAELRSQSNLATAEGRAQFLAAARPHIQKIAAPALRLQVMKEAARIADLTQDEAQRILEPGAEPKPAYRKPAPARRTNPPPSSPEWKLLSSVVLFPSLASEMDLAHIDASLPESSALKALSERYLANDRGISGAMLVEHFQNSPHAQILFDAQAYAMDLDETEEIARQKVQHALWKIQINHMNARIRALGEKLRQGILSKEENLQYGRMILEVKALEQRLQSEGRGAAR
jgi:DNA primase